MVLGSLHVDIYFAEVGTMTLKIVTVYLSF